MLRWLAELRVPGPRRVLAWQAVIDSIGNGLAAAIVTLYLLGPVGLSTFEVGVCLGIAGAMTLLATVPASLIAARVGAHRFAIGSNLVRVGLFCLLPLAGDLAHALVILALIGVAEAASYSIYQVIIADAVGGDARMEVLATRRVIGNVGFLAATPLIAAVVAIGTRDVYVAAFVLNAATFAVSAWLVSRLPGGHTPAEVDGPRLQAVRDPRYVTLAALSAVSASTVILLDVGIPIWVSEATVAPTWVIAVAVAINTLMVIALQVRVAAQTSTVARSGWAVLTAAAVFAVACVCFAASSGVGAATAAALICAAAVCISIGELLVAGGWWTISYEMANPARRTEYLALFDLGHPIVAIGGPLLVVAIVASGATGWAAYAAAVLLAGVATKTLATERPRAAEAATEPH